MSDFNAFAVSRLRMGRDGDGVTTLVAGVGCPLDCRYCLNPQCRKQNGKRYTPEELFALVAVDGLYFEATGGGITFGGGEPLLQAEFIRDFILLTKRQERQWHFYIETCLNVPREKLTLLDGLIDKYIVDCKSMKPQIYTAYTRASPDRAYENLVYLSEKCPGLVRVRVPQIPAFNTSADCDEAERKLREMGFTDIDRFTYITDIEKYKKANR